MKQHAQHHEQQQHRRRRRYRVLIRDTNSQDYTATTSNSTSGSSNLFVRLADEQVQALHHDAIRHGSSQKLSQAQASLVDSTHWDILRNPSSTSSGVSNVIEFLPLEIEFLLTRPRSWNQQHHEEDASGGGGGDDDGVTHTVVYASYNGGIIAFEATQGKRHLDRMGFIVDTNGCDRWPMRESVY